MARIHTVNPYPLPAHSGKGPLLRITSGMATGHPENAPAFSAAQREAERRETARVMAGAPGHLIDSGLPPKPMIGRVTGTPIVKPAREGVAARLQRLRGTFGARGKPIS